MPGQEVYSVFGHSAIRVIDKENNVDQVYNFGMFDFDTPNFEYKYLKGKLKYYRGIQKTEDFIEIYTYEKRLVIEQVLNLTPQEKGKILSRLQFLYKPENKCYLYSFLEKNCSTEILDLLNHGGVNFQNQKLEKSNRDLISSYLKEMPWLELGINMVLGKSLDNKSSRYQSMFLPDYLKKEIGASTLNGEKLVRLEQGLNSIQNIEKPNKSRFFSPVVIFSFTALLFLFWFPVSIRIFTCLGIGLTGSIILVLWVFSEHVEVKSNLNVIWCNPLYLLYIAFLRRHKTKKILNFIFLGTIAISILIWVFKVQIFDVSVIPILIILGTLNFKELKNKGKRNEHALNRT